MQIDMISVITSDADASDITNMQKQLGQNFGRFTRFNWHVGFLRPHDGLEAHDRCQAYHKGVYGADYSPHMVRNSLLSVCENPAAHVIFWDGRFGLHPKIEKCVMRHQEFSIAHVWTDPPAISGVWSLLRDDIGDVRFAGPSDREYADFVKSTIASGHLAVQLDTLS